MKTDKQIAITSKEIAETLIKEYDSEDMDSISIDNTDILINIYNKFLSIFDNENISYCPIPILQNGVFKFQTELHDRTWHFCPNFGQI